MCEFLLKLSSSEDKDDPKTSWQSGDIFNIKEDGFEWGKEEKEPFFTVIKIPGVRASACKFLLGPWIQNDNVEVYRNSLWRWDFDNKKFERKQDKLTKTKEDLINL